MIQIQKVISHEELKERLNKVNIILDKCKEVFKHIDIHLLSDIAELLIEIAFKEDEIILFKYKNIDEIEQIEKTANIELSVEDINIGLIRTDKKYAVIIYDYIDKKVKYV